jgi:hypothetical protein
MRDDRRVIGYHGCAKPIARVSRPRYVEQRLDRRSAESPRGGIADVDHEGVFVGETMR